MKKPIFKFPPNWVGIIIIMIYVAMTIMVMCTPLGSNDGTIDRIPLTDKDRLLFASVLLVLFLGRYELYDDHIEYRWLFIKCKSIDFTQISNGMIFQKGIDNTKHLRQQVVYLAKKPFLFTTVPRIGEQRRLLKKHRRNIVKIELPIGREQEVIAIIERCIGNSLLIAN